MRNVVAITLVIAILAPILVKNVVLLSFYAHRDKIARELCQEKNIENSCCKGSCVLVKNLNKFSDEKEIPVPFKDHSEIVYLSESFELLLPTSIDQNTFVSHYLPPMSSYLPGRVHRPPGC